MERRLENQVLLGGGLLALLLVVIWAITYRNTSTLFEGANQVVHTHEVRSLSDEILLALVDAETGQRGFIITGEEEFLEPYNTGVGQVRELVDRLQAKTTDNASQQSRIVELRKLIGSRLSLLSEGIQRRRESEAESRAFIANKRGKLAMDAIRVVIAQIDDEEDALLKDRRQQSNLAFGSAVTTGLVTALAGLALIGALVHLLNRGVRMRAKAADELHQQRELLRATLTSIGDAVIATDTETQVTFLNPVAEQLTGWSIDEARGQPLEQVFNIVNEKTRAKVANPAIRALQEGTIVGLANHTVLIAKDGTHRPIEDSASPIRDQLGTVNGAVLVFRDVSQEREVERALSEEIKLSNFELEIAAAVTRPDTLATTLTTCCELLQQHFDCAFAGVWLKIENEPQLELLASAGLPLNGAGPPRRLLVGEGTIGRIAEQRTAATSNAVADDARITEQAWATANGLTTFSGQPLLVEDRLVGVVALFGDRPLSDAASHALAVAANPVALAVERKRTEHQLKDARDRLNVALAAGRIGTFLWNIKADVLRWDSFKRELYGLKPDQVINNLQRFIDLVHPDDRAHVETGFHACAERGAALDLEFRVVGGDGRERWFLNRGTTMTDAAGAPELLVGACVDVTAQKAAEHAIVERERQFRVLADSIPHLAWMAFPDGQVFWFNQRWYDYTGATLENMQSEGWQSVLETEEVARILEKFNRALATGEPWEDVIRLRRHDGQFRWHLSRMLPVRDEEGRIVRWFGTNTDITEQREAAAALREAAARKDEFLAMLGHELRNPLAGIVTGVHVLRMLDSNAEAAEMQAVIDRQAAHMSRIVDDLLDVSRIAQGKLGIRQEHLDLRELLSCTVHDYRNAHPLDNCELSVELPAREVWIYGDRTRLAQVITNLLHNGCKFADKANSVTVSLAADNALGRAQVTIVDCGIGMTQETLERIFEPFHQADATLDRSRGGLGLGLALAKGVVELHGGSITASSQGLGRGAKFIVSLPLASKPQSAGGVATNSHGTASARKVLLIDDRRDAILPLQKMLSMRGHQVATAADGAAGLSLAKEFLPDVVLCDIGLAGPMSGYDVAREVRGMPELADSYLVAVTGYGQDEDRRRAHETGFDYHVTKPLSREQLFTVVEDMPRFPDGFSRSVPAKD